MYAELLSRLVVRLTPSEAHEMFRWATTLAHDPAWTHWWLYEPLGHLLRRSLKAIPAASRATSVLDVMRLPLPAEKKTLGDVRDWPELYDLVSPSDVHITRGGMEWDRRVRELIDGVRATERHSRTCAILRLWLLHRRNLLTTPEQQDFAAALWAVRDTPEGLPSVSDRYQNIFRELPEPELGSGERAFQHDVVHQLASGSKSEHSLRGLAQACPVPHKAVQSFSLATRDALAIFDHLSQCPSSAASASADGSQRDKEFRLQRDEKLREAIAYALANAVLPAVSAADLGSKRIERLFEILRSNEWPSLMVVLP